MNLITTSLFYSFHTIDILLKSLIIAYQYDNTMKFLKFNLLLILLILNGCATDDGELNIDTANLLGVWNLVTINSENGQATITEDGITVSVDFELSSENEDLQITFNEDPNVVSSEGSFTQVTTISTLGQTEVEETLIEGVFLDGNWILDGDQLTINSENEFSDDFDVVPTFEITRLTDTILEIRQDLNQQVIFTENDLETNGILILVFQR